MMNELLQSVREFWYLWLILALLVIVAIFIWRKANVVLKNHSDKFNKQLANAEREKRLLDRYSDSTNDIGSDTPEDIIDGFAVVADAKIQKFTNPDAEFSTLPDRERLAYGMKFFFTDAEEKLSLFYRQNSHPLTDVVTDCLEESSSVAGKLARRMYNMTDDDNENVSFDRTLADKLDDEFNKNIDRNELKTIVAQYILQK